MKQRGEPMKAFQLVSNQGRLRIHVMTGWFVLAMSVVIGYTNWTQSMRFTSVHPLVPAIALALFVLRASIGAYQDLADALTRLRGRIASWIPRRWMRLPQGFLVLFPGTDHPASFVRVRLYSVFCVYRA
jgi:hypothetical protein